MTETVITFTMKQLFAFVGTFCGLVVSISAAMGVLFKAIKKIKQPNTIQDSRIQALENRADATEKMLDNDNKRLTRLEDEGRLTLRAVLALLKHGINGNDTQAMKDSMTDIEYFLVNGKIKN